MSKDTAFNGETTPHHTFPCSDSQCLPPGDPRTLCTKHGSPITGKSFIDNMLTSQVKGPWFDSPRRRPFSPFSVVLICLILLFLNIFSFFDRLTIYSRLIIAGSLSPFISKIISPQVSHGHPLILSLFKMAETTKFISTVLWQKVNWRTVTGFRYF